MTKDMQDRSQTDELLEDATDELTIVREDCQRIGEALGFDAFVDPEVMIEKIRALMIKSKAIDYMFGDTDALDWNRIVQENLTPPWPLENHARAMGLFKPETVQEKFDRAMAANHAKASAKSAEQRAALLEALQRIADTDPDDGTSWFHDVANAAIANATQQRNATGGEG